MPKIYITNCIHHTHFKIFTPNYYYITIVAYIVCIFVNKLELIFITYQESADIKLDMAAGLSGIRGVKEGSN